jgi:putative copper export protein
MSELQSNSADPSMTDSLDRLLARSLAKRPEPRPIPNLADRAIERARALDCLADQQRRSLVIHRWRLRIVHAAAVLLIGLLILVGGKRLLSERQSMASSDESISTSDTTPPSAGTHILWLGGLVLICTLAGLGTENAIAPDRASLAV